MAISLKQRKLLKLAEKRRARRPEPRTIVVDTTLKLKPREIQRFTNRCAPLLFEVEKAIQSVYREHPQLDDEQVSQALVCAIKEIQPKSETLSQILVQLAIAAEVAGADREDWRMAMRVIRESVQTRCSGAGSRGYLNYARGFVGNFS